MDPPAFQFKVSLQLCLQNKNDIMTSGSYYPLPATLLPRRLISPLAGITMTVVKQHHHDGLERTFPYDIFQLFL